MELHLQEADSCSVCQGCGIVLFARVVELFCLPGLWSCSVCQGCGVVLFARVVELQEAVAVRMNEECCQ